MTGILVRGTTAIADIKETGVFVLTPNPNNVFVDWFVHDYHPTCSMWVSYKEGCLGNTSCTAEIQIYYIIMIVPAAVCSCMGPTLSLNSLPICIYASVCSLHL